MTEPRGRSLRLPDLPEATKLDRTLLKDLAAEKLHDYISRGDIPEGTRLTEREVSRLLGVSRISAHEALLILESEGLVENRPDGRHVIELTEERVRQLYVVRVVLEKLVMELAVANNSDGHLAILRAKLDDLGKAVASKDHVLCAEADLALHRAIWRQTGNTYLVKSLEPMAGVMVVLTARTRLYYKPENDQNYREHCQLVDLIASGDAVGAGQLIEYQLREATGKSVLTFHAASEAQPPDREGV